MLNSCIQISRNKFKHIGSFIECFILVQKATIHPKKQWWEVFSLCISSSTELWKNESQPNWISKVKPFIHIFDWRAIVFLPDSKGWSTFERNYHAVAPNIVIINGEKEVIRKAYISKHCLKLEYKATMMISNKEKDCT